MMRILFGLAGITSLVGLLAIGEPAIRAQAPATPPDFSGVYYPVQAPGGRARAAAAGTTSCAAAAHEVGATRGWFGWTGAGCTEAHSCVPGAMGGDPEITHVRIIRIRSTRPVHPIRDAEHDEYVLWHGDHAIERQDHDVRRDE